MTIIDGDFASLYSYVCDDENVFTLTSVKDTPLGQYETWAECSKSIKEITNNLLEMKKEIFVDLISVYVPYFREQFGT